MLLRSIQNKHKVSLSVAMRSMSIKPVNKLSDQAEEARDAVIEEHRKRTPVHESDLSPPVYSQREYEQLAEKYNMFPETDEDRMSYTKPGDEKRTEFYSAISQINEDDHDEIKKTKKNIKKLLDQELEFLGFKQDLKEYEESDLIEDAFKTIEERKSFYFKYDNQKTKRNKKIYDVYAPGNTHRKINYVLPHESIHPQHHIDVKTLTEDDITELYAYYTYYIDFHIGQIRRETKEKSYIPAQFKQIAWNDSESRNKFIDNKFIEYYHHWREPDKNKWRSQTQEIDFQKEKDALPVNPHPDPRAFHKNEVEWKDEEKFPHVANRLGYPIMAETPFEKISGFERAPAHPSYQLQAFVQTPSMDPDPTLNFEKMETIYENKRIGEWIRMWKWIGTGILPFWAAFYTFEMYQADGPPSLQWFADSGAWPQIPLQFQDSGDFNLEGIRYCDEHDYMNIHYAYKRAFLRPMHTFYQAAVLAMLHGLNFDYVTKMNYNKDKDLVFVYKPEGWFNDKEYVYEVHHLESMVPGVVLAYQDLGIGKKDGITSLNCMDTKDCLKLYNDPKYWNLELRDDFLAQTRTMWPALCNKYEGRVVSIGNDADEEAEQTIHRINRELDEAVEKYGSDFRGHHTYHSQFKDKIRQKRKQIADSATS